MTKQQHAEISRMIKEYTRVNGATPTKARNALIKEGLYTKAGKIAKKYGGEPKPVK